MSNSFSGEAQEPVDKLLMQRRRAKAAFFFALLWLLVTASALVWGVAVDNWENSQLYAYGVPTSVLGLLATIVIGCRPMSRSVRIFLAVTALFMMIFVALAVMHWA